MFYCYFANRIEFLRDSNRIEPISPNIRNGIVSESGLTRRTHDWREKCQETSRIPPNKKNQFVAIRAIRGLCGIGVLVNMPRKNGISIDMTIAVDWDVKPQTKQNNSGQFLRTI